MKLKILLPALFLSTTLAHAQMEEPLQAFDLGDVRLLEGPFKQAEGVDLDYILDLEPDRLLAPFLREAGLSPRKESYGNWENSGLDGHIGGHYLSALAMMYASTGDPRMKDRLDYMIGQLRVAQLANGNGYVGGIPGSRELWQEIRNGDIRAGAFSLNDRWVPLYNIHKTYAGLRDAHVFGQSGEALEMLIALTDWMLETVDGLSDAQIQDMLRSEHGGLNETFADVAALTGEEKYLQLARRFSQRALLDPLSESRDVLTGMHANTQIPKVIGFKRIADLENDRDWNAAAVFFWENVTSRRSVSIGGNSVREHFHPTDDFSSMVESVQGPETCNTYNMLRLTRQLFLSDPQDRYLEFYERALYNHILSTQNPDQGGFVYFTPMRPGHYRVYSQPDTSFWCCVGSGLENHAKYGDLIYAHSDEALHVNLFIASTVCWEEKGVTLTQRTRFPDEPETTLLVGTDAPVPFTLKLRYPAWVPAGGLEVAVNGEPVTIQAGPGGFVSLFRTWEDGDTVEMKLPMRLQAEQLPDGENFYSFRYGPIILAAKTTDQKMPGLFADDSRGGHIADGPKLPLAEMPVIVGDPEQLTDHLQPVPGQPLTFSIGKALSPRYDDLQLIPFFRLHESRYVLYWQCETEEGYQAMLARVAAEEAEQQRLDAATIDMVYPGEQQPESDHSIASENSNMGTHMGRHWRDATGWFSYVMRDPEQEAEKLRILYFGGDRDRHFKILVNGETIATEHLDGSHGPVFFPVEYPIPESIRKTAGDTLTVRFEAQPGSTAGGVYEVRLMR